MKTSEIRMCNSRVEYRAASDDAPARIGGYAAVFDVLSENLGGFREQIAPGAFDGVLDDDVRAVFNHDDSLILGRTAASTLRISVDKTGLRYEVDLPSAQYAQDLAESISRGDVDSSSFRFRVAIDGDSWDEDPDTGAVIRTITEIGKLIDVSPVTIPAYSDTTVAVRALETWRAEHPATVTTHNLTERLRLAQID